MTFASAAWRTPSSAASTTSVRFTTATSSRILPEMIRETSSRSSISFAWCRVLRSIASSARALPASSMRPDRSSATQVRITPSGERSSCDRVARNSSFVRLAASAAARTTCSRASASRRASSARRARSNARTVATSTAGSIGSVSEASAPPSRARTVSSSRTCVAETCRTATEAVSGLALSRRHTSKPSTPGRFTSRRTSRGASSVMRRSASSPVLPSMTSYPASRRMRDLV